MKINGVEHSFPDGMNVLEACLQVGIYVPHFCYHPALSVVGSCRMCKVEVIQNGRSRVDISCNLPVSDGLEIITDSPEVRQAQQMTLELLLANHPLDCPICDDAGECDLQNFYLEYGRHDSRLRELKRRKRKAADIGRSIILDSERCVLCSRCVRFLAEVTRTEELGIFGMGAGEELMVRPGAELSNDYAGNVVDLCPVGALTDKDFRFKRRIWFLSSTPSICQLCSRGCNVRIDYDINPFHTHKRDFEKNTHRTEATAYGRIQRIKPVVNEAVNGNWICDCGRYGYRSTDAADRLLHPVIAEEGDLRQVELSQAIRQIASGITSALSGGSGKVAVVISPRLTSEELFAVWALLRGSLKLPSIDHRLPIDPDWYGDDLLRTPDPFPNRTGCEWIGIEPSEGGTDIAGLPQAIGAGRVDTLVSILTDPRDFLDGPQIKRLKRRFFILRNLPDELKPWVDAALPAAAWGEYRGSFVNFQGRIQRLEAAFDPLGEAQPVWRLMAGLSAALKKPLGWKTLGEVQTAMAKDVSLFMGLSWDAIGVDGTTVPVHLAKAAG